VRTRIAYCVLRIAFVLAISYQLSAIRCYADTVYFKSGSTQKGLIVEEYYDSLVFSAESGESHIPKSDVDEIFFDEPYQNSLYLGKRSEAAGDFERAGHFYQAALESNPDFKGAKNAIKGLEDAKWHFKKSWRYSELKTILREQLGIGLKRVKNKIVIAKAFPAAKREADLLEGDSIISCWGRPLTGAGLKNASRILAGLSNTILEILIERDIKVEYAGGIILFPPMEIKMELEGPVMQSLKEESNFYKSGLKEGDLIVKINGEATRYMELSMVKKKIFGLPKEKLLTIRRGATLMRKRTDDGAALNAMWVWYSKEILLNEAKKKELLNFCKQKNIGELFFQLQYQFLPYKNQTVCRILYETRLRSFLKEAHSQDIKVYALDGSAEFCLENNHRLVLGQLEAILAFNKKGVAPERFDGVHYDNEPYLLPAFNSASKESIIDQFLALNKKCKNLIGSSGSRLEFGIDIPFWFDQINRLDAKLIDICDNIGIMDYRNFASGPDGIITHGMDEMKYAAKAGKKVFIGVETSRCPTQETCFVSALNEGEFNKAPDTVLEQTRFEGFSLRIQPYANKIYIGLVRPEGANEKDYNKALAKLESALGRISKPDNKEELDDLTFNVMQAISSNPELRDVQPQEYMADDGKTYLMFLAKEVMLEKLTFADMTEKDLSAVLAEAKKEFVNYPSFAGFAIHYYKSYKELCEKKE
jgi:hypothetical protein